MPAVLCQLTHEHKWLYRNHEKKGKWYQSSFLSGTNSIVFPLRCFLWICFWLSFGRTLQNPGHLTLKESFFVCMCNLKEYQEKLFIVYVWSICNILRAMLYIKGLIKQVWTSWEMQAHIQVHKKKGHDNPFMIW